MVLSPNRTIRDFTITELIGKGGMGEIYLAKDINLNRDVAIKVLKSELTNDPSFAKRFINEARVQAMLIHANIVTLYSFFEEAGHYYMVMEHAPGTTLDTLIKQINIIPEPRALNIFRQICEALDFAHKKDIVHRDIKPSNIMVDIEKNDNVKILDFGIARILSDARLTRTGTMLGTVNYMSPEQVLAEKDIDHRSDIFSAGILLYEMLTGRLPYDVDTESQFNIQEQIIYEDIPDPLQFYEFIRPSTINLLEALTQKKRDDRPNSILQAYQDNFKYTDTPTVSQEEKDLSIPDVSTVSDDAGFNDDKQETDTEHKTTYSGIHELSEPKNRLLDFLFTIIMWGIIILFSVFLFTHCSG